MAAYSIRAVARATGLSPDTLRAWERRYGVVEPVRGQGGRRHYAADDVERLRLLAMAVEQGHSIGMISDLDDDALRRIVAGASERVDHGLGAVVEEVMSKVESLDAAGCERSLSMSMVSLPVDVVTDEVLIPVLRETGSRWRSGELTIAHERMLSSIVRKLAMTTLASYGKNASGARIVFGTLPGEDHELGSLLAAVNAAALGCRCEYVGSQLPGAEFARLARHLGAVAVALSLITTPPTGSAEELSRLCRALPEGVQLLVGGPAATLAYDPAEHARATILANFEQLRRHVRTLVN